MCNSWLVTGASSFIAGTVLTYNPFEFELLPSFGASFHLYRFGKCAFPHKPVTRPTFAPRQAEELAELRGAAQRRLGGDLGLPNRGRRQQPGDAWKGQEDVGRQLTSSWRKRKKATG